MYNYIMLFGAVPRGPCSCSGTLGGVPYVWVKQMTALTLDHLRQRRDQIIALAGRHGASNVRVFGSVARGDAVAGSDLDLLVDFEPGRSLMDHGELIMDLEAVLGCRVDVVGARGLHDRFRARVLADAVVL
jgi:uncharacterized protein